MTSHGEIFQESPRNVAKIYAPVLIVVILCTLQAIFVMVHQKVGKRRKSKKKYMTIAPEEWFNESMLDDVIYASISGMLLYVLCAYGCTNVAWVILLPLLIVGGVTTTYYIFTSSMQHAPQVFFGNKKTV